MYDDLISDLGYFSDKPLEFVYWAFPWKVAGTDLAKAEGPEWWQAQILKMLGEGLISIDEAIRLAVTSGHGVGKSALVAWIILWAISTFEDTRGVVTANTENQLKTKTWVELATWYRRFIARDLFKMTATALFSVDPDRERTWRIDMVPWSERNTEAFAGLHNQGKRILLIMDEASAIADLIHEVAEGALTDENTQIIWVMFGNPTRNKGRFRDAFEGGRFTHRWKTLKVDSRTVTFTNKRQIADWIEDYGEDSDFVRVRVKGEFPRIDSESFISFGLASGAVNRDVVPQGTAPLFLGVDVGRFGDDPSVLYPRRARDASSFKIDIRYGLDTVELAQLVAKTVNDERVDLAIVDEGGVGAGVVDNLRHMRIPVLGVDFGSRMEGTNTIQQAVKYANRRAEIWGATRDWLVHGSIPSLTIPSPSGTSLTLVDELSGPTYGLNNKEEILLEAKKDMRRRGVASPNVADALALTFASPHFVPATPSLGPEHMAQQNNDYDPFNLKRIYSQ